jgi:hypothetical protein
LCEQDRLNGQVKNHVDKETRELPLRILSTPIYPQYSTPIVAHFSRTFNDMIYRHLPSQFHNEFVSNRFVTAELLKTQ